MGKRPSKNVWLAWSVSLGVGLLPGAKGTYGSLLTLALAWGWLSWQGGALAGPGYALVILAVIFIAVWLSDLAEKRAVFGPEKDPGSIVIDEAAGLLVALYGLSLGPWWALILAFAAFRVFDILKPFPVNWCQNAYGGLGVVLDDLAAGAYAWLTVKLVLYLAG